MRFTILPVLAAAALAFTTAPSEAAWSGYFNKSVEFSFFAPGELKTERGTYSGALAGQREATVFQSEEDNIQYRVIVVDFSSRPNDEAALLAEAATAFQAGKTVLADTTLQVDDIGGRKISVDLPNGMGRSMGAFYFRKGHLIQLHVTVLPANGDYGTPDTGRFIDSLAFLPARVNPGDVELAVFK
jgi:hypothetical protein